MVSPTAVHAGNCWKNSTDIKDIVTLKLLVARLCRHWKLLMLLLLMRALEYHSLDEATAKLYARVERTISSNYDSRPNPSTLRSRFNGSIGSLKVSMVGFQSIRTWPISSVISSPRTTFGLWKFLSVRQMASK